MAETALSTQRALLTLVALPICFFAAIMFFSRPPQLQLSTEHKGEIERIAGQICVAAEVQPCTVEWSGKHKWFGTLSKRGPQSVASLEQLKLALREPEWSPVVTANERQFTNGKYLVTYIIGDGSIAITSAD